MLWSMYVFIVLPYIMVFGIYIPLNLMYLSYREQGYRHIVYPTCKGSHEK